jgi:hypothetical protein
MRAVKVKAIRRALRKELEDSGERWLAHPRLYTNVEGHTMLKFTLQYVSTGGRKMLKLAKKIYRLSGLLPENYNGKNS